MDERRRPVIVILKTLTAIGQFLIIATVIGYAWLITDAFFSLQ